MIGIAVGVFCYFTVTWVKGWIGYDDALDCFGVHACGGAFGAILTGVFAINQYGGTPGLIEGNAGQVVNQVIGVCIVIAYDVVVSLIILAILKATIGLRVNAEVEWKVSISPSTAKRCTDLLRAYRKTVRFLPEGPARKSGAFCSACGRGARLAKSRCSRLAIARTSPFEPNGSD